MRPVLPTLLHTILWSGLVMGCAGTPLAPSTGLLSLTSTSAGRTDTCSAFLSHVRTTVSDAGRRDVEATTVRGTQGLRVNRFLARIGRDLEVRDTPAFKAWTSRLRELDDEATLVELRNLPEAERNALLNLLPENSGGERDLIEAIRKCADQSERKYLATPTRRRALLQAAVVKDNYSEALRVAGAYPLAAIPVSQGWDRWRADNLGSFEKPRSEIPVTGKITSFAPKSRGGALSPSRVKALVDRSRDPVLGIPNPKGKARAQLLAAFAPVWQIDVTGDYDRIGHPAWQPSSSTIGIDIERPMVFTRLSHVIVDDRVLLQLVYGIWLRERPIDGPLDLLGGKIDGVIWRVTLDDDGRPLLYDTIHACGCYHLFFPASRLRDAPARAAPGYLSETPAILRTAPKLRAGQRIAIRLASRSHYVTHVSAISARKAVPNRVRYTFSNESVLRSLPLPSGGRRSLYDQTGLVVGSERLERYILWPMGIASSGTMRQWGHHATAFVGRRHFDDPELIDTVFRRSTRLANRQQ